MIQKDNYQGPMDPWLVSMNLGENWDRTEFTINAFSSAT